MLEKKWVQVLSMQEIQDKNSYPAFIPEMYCSCNAIGYIDYVYPLDNVFNIHFINDFLNTKTRGFFFKKEYVKFL